LEKLIKIHSADNVALAVSPIEANESALGVRALEPVAFGHKIALRDIAKGKAVIKYGYPIGFASRDILAGEWVHTHNLKTGLSKLSEYTYAPSQKTQNTEPAKELFFEGYENEDGSAGIRNEIWVLPLVGCVNQTAEALCAKAQAKFGGLCDGIFSFTHPYGCSQLGNDHAQTQKILAGLAKHPNAAGVLLLSLGCENNNLASFLPVLGEYNHNRIKTLVTQDCEDELEAGLKIIEELALAASKRKRVKIAASRLVIGYKCGGSDAFSGITANPLCGRLTDSLTQCGGRAIMTEVPEMFGAETILMNRAKNRDVFDDIVTMINGFKQYFFRHGQAVYENPSPGNKEGGITTLEEKSLGCIQKGGTAPVNAVLGCGEPCREAGLNLLTGPGNDIVSCTNLAASGADIILFTTGRGTPLGAPVPTIKIASNSALAKKKANWIDYDAGGILAGKPFDTAAAELLELVLEVAGGKTETKNEMNGYREIAIFKDGVTL
jgi:altronate hydrolase